MKKMTICRSEVLLAAGVALFATPVAAQDPLITPETREHVVRRGETLWSLAEYYYANPLLWPEIYRLNPDVVEDPHWIYPGERLRLMPLEPVAVEEPPIEPADPEVVEATPPDEPEAAPPPPPAAGTQTETVFARNRIRRTNPVTMPGAERMDPNAGRMLFYSAGFLTEEADLPWARVLGATNQSTFSTLTSTSSANIYEQVRVEAPAGATYQIGDTLLTAFYSRQVVNWGNVIKPTGLLRVTSVTGRMAHAEVIVQFARVSDGQVALPIEPWVGRSGDRTIPIENGMEGTVIATRDEAPVPGLGEILFIDLGRSDGVALGDVFEIYLEQEDSGAPRPVAFLSVVHVREESATGRVYSIEDIGFGSGTAVRLVRRSAP